MIEVFVVLGVVALVLFGYAYYFVYGPMKRIKELKEGVENNRVGGLK